MRFKFCGGIDAPEWFLQETVFLSQISAVRFKLIAIVVYRHLLGGILEVDKLDKYLSIMGENRTDSDVKALVAAMSLILEGGAKYDVSIEELQKELQQVGLPREHGRMLARPFSKFCPQLVMRLKSKTLRVSRCKNVSWRSDFVVARSGARMAERTEGVIMIETEETGQQQGQGQGQGQQLLLQLDSNTSSTYSMSLSHDMVLSLLHEAKQALQVMQEIQKK